MYHKIILLMAVNILSTTSANTYSRALDSTMASYESSFTNHKTKNTSLKLQDSCLSYAVTDTYTEIHSIIQDLKSFSHEESIDFAGFEKSEKSIHDRCTKIQETTLSNNCSSSWKSELAYALVYYQSMKYASSKRSLAKRCDYHGDDLVEGLALLCVRILALYKPKNDPHIPEFHMKMARLEHRYDVLQERIRCDSKMSSDTKFEVRILKEDVEEAFNITKQSGDYKKPTGRSMFCFLA